MNKISQIVDLLKRLADFLAANDQDEWADSLRGLAAELPTSPELTKGKVRSLYGGMGSFNDIVLYGKDGSVLTAENDEFDRLRSELYTLCREP